MIRQHGILETLDRLVTALQLSDGSLTIIYGIPVTTSDAFRDGREVKVVQHTLLSFISLELKADAVTHIASTGLS